MEFRAAVAGHARGTGKAPTSIERIRGFEGGTVGADDLRAFDFTVSEAVEFQVRFVRCIDFHSWLGLRDHIERLGLAVPLGPESAPYAKVVAAIVSLSRIVHGYTFGLEESPPIGRGSIDNYAIHVVVGDGMARIRSAPGRASTGEIAAVVV